MVYLVCDKCDYFYELQRGEKPTDFDLTCGCGGSLHADTVKHREKSSDGNETKGNKQITTISNNWMIIRTHKKEEFISKVNSLEKMGYKLYPESFCLGVAGTGVSKYHVLMSRNRELKLANLFPCPDCEHNISKKAKICPNCGRELNDIDTDITNEIN
jgi:RNA polymerase subunit RPABC4/transcription elongation factor Spt4